MAMFNWRAIRIHIPKPVRDILTGPDNATYDGLRVASILGVIVYLVYAGIDLIVRKHGFDCVSFGTGFAAIAGGTGVGVAIKQMTGSEPPCPPPST
jgi:hypothetical protein